MRYSSGLTPKQKQLLEYIESFTETRGYAPSQSEIAKYFQFKSLGTVQNYLVRLERHGLLKKTWNARRGMEIVPPQPHSFPLVTTSPATVPLPLSGRVAAGRPIEAIADNETLEVPAYMIRRGPHFVLRVKGDSMTEDGIFDGDYAIIQKRADAENGQTVVALLSNEATIKKYYRRAGRIELHPANRNYKPLIVDAATTDFRIEGVLVGILRIMK